MNLKNVCSLSIIMIILVSCNSNSGSVSEKDLELQKKELDLKQKELELKVKQMALDSIQNAKTSEQKTTSTNPAEPPKNSVPTAVTNNSLNNDLLIGSWMCDDPDCESYIDISKQAGGGFKINDLTHESAYYGVAENNGVKIKYHHTYFYHGVQEDPKESTAILKLINSNKFIWNEKDQTHYYRRK